MSDMPLESLLKYGGSSPLPEDFDVFWDRQLKALDELDPQAEFIPAPYRYPNAEAGDLWFTGLGGAKIHAVYAYPKNITGKIPAVLMFHGYNGRACDYTGLLGYAGQGMAAFFLDTRGQLGKSEDRGGVKGTTFRGGFIKGVADNDPEKLLYKYCFTDAAELARIVAALPFADADRIYTYGSSHGAALCVACAALYPKIRKAVFCSVFLSDYKRIQNISADTSAYTELREYFRNSDPLRKTSESVFNLLGYIDVQNLAPRIKAECLMMTGMLDTTCPPSTQFAVYNKITAPKRYLLFYDFSHEIFPGSAELTMDFFLYGNKEGNGYGGY